MCECVTGSVCDTSDHPGRFVTQVETPRLLHVGRYDLDPFVDCTRQAGGKRFQAGSNYPLRYNLAPLWQEQVPTGSRLAPGALPEPRNGPKRVHFEEV